MKVVVTAAGALRRLVDFREKIEVEADRIDLALTRVSEMYPAFQRAVFDSDNCIRAVHQVFVNGEMVPRAEMSRPLCDKDEIDIITAIAGG